MTRISDTAVDVLVWATRNGGLVGNLETFEQQRFEFEHLFRDRKWRHSAVECDNILEYTQRGKAKPNWRDLAVECENLLEYTQERGSRAKPFWLKHSKTSTSRSGGAQNKPRV